MLLDVLLGIKLPGLAAPSSKAAVEQVAGKTGNRRQEQSVILKLRDSERLKNIGRTLVKWEEHTELTIFL